MRSLSEISKFRSSVKSPIAEGSLPAMLQLDKYSHVRLFRETISSGNGVVSKGLSPRLKTTSRFAFRSDFHGNTLENALLFKYRYCKWLREENSGKVPEKRLLPRSKYVRFVQLFISLGMVPESELNPRESF